MPITRLGANRRDTGSQIRKMGQYDLFRYGEPHHAGEGVCLGNRVPFAREGRLLQIPVVEIDGQVSWIYHW